MTPRPSTARRPLLPGAAAVLAELQAADPADAIVRGRDAGLGRG